MTNTDLKDIISFALSNSLMAFPFSSVLHLWLMECAQDMEADNYNSTIEAHCLNLI